MDILDWTKDIVKVDNKHSAFFPHTIRCVLAGPSGAGKTNLMIHLLRTKGLLHYDDVYIYGPSLHQPIYSDLRKYYENLEKVFYKLSKRNVRIGHFYDSDEDIVDPSMLNPDKSHIMIFDDVMLANQSKIKDYFCRGRHNNVNVFYLVQSLHKIAKHCIRENCNIFILFRQDDKTMKYFHEAYLEGDMGFDEFKSFYDKVWSKENSFIVINLWDKAEFGRYWANYNEIYSPNKYEEKIL